MLTAFPVPTFTTTRFGTVWPAEKLRLEAFGSDSPAGYTVRWEEADGPVTVMLRTTDVASAGTLVAPPRTTRLRDSPAIHGLPGTPGAGRESSSRNGVTPVYSAPLASVE